MKTIALLVTRECYLSGITGPIDLFNIANQHWQYHTEDATEPLFQWRLLSLDGEAVTSSCGIRLAVDRPLDDSDYDAILVPGLHYRNEAGFRVLLSEMQVLIPWLLTQHQNNALLAATCTGTFVLADTGLLNGRHATTTWWLSRLFRHLYPAVLLQDDRMIVEDSGLICAGAVTSYLNLALHLVEKFAGQAIAAQCARLMLIDSKQLSQAPFANLQVGWQHQDDVVSQAQSWMQRNLHRELNLEDIANSISVSSRTLIRRFKEAAGQTPLAFLQSLRVEAAKRLLENTDLSLEMIVEKVGYSDVSSFRRLFSRTTQLTPREYRSRFGTR